VPLPFPLPPLPLPPPPPFPLAPTKYCQWEVDCTGAGLLSIAADSVQEQNHEVAFSHPFN